MTTTTTPKVTSFDGEDGIAYIQFQPDRKPKKVKGRVLDDERGLILIDTVDDEKEIFGIELILNCSIESEEEALKIANAIYQNYSKI